MKLATFNPKPEIVNQLSEDERSLMEAYRALHVTDRLTVVYTAQQLRQKLIADDVWFQIQQLYAGAKRSFWMDRASLFSKKGETYDTVQAVQEFADDYLTTWLAAKGLECDPFLRVERDGRERTSGRVWFDCFLRRGRYRVEANGLPDWMREAWGGPR